MSEKKPKPYYNPNPCVGCPRAANCTFFKPMGEPQHCVWIFTRHELGAAFYQLPPEPEIEYDDDDDDEYSPKPQPEHRKTKPHIDIAQSSLKSYLVNNRN